MQIYSQKDVNKKALKGARIFVSRASFPSTDDGEYYWVDLIGLQVFNRDGALLGTVTEYRYKSDLDGSPIVSVTMRLVDATDGTTVWQGTSTKMTQYFGSLSRTAHAAVENLIQQMSGTARASSRSRTRIFLPETPNAAGAPPVTNAPARRGGKFEPDPEQIRRRGQP